MLVLTRKYGERIRIGSDVEVVVVAISRGTVRLGIDAPKHIAIHRAEVLRGLRDPQPENKSQPPPLLAAPRRQTA